MMAKKIEYLTFEGGGGKGIVYLGAIKALEKKELPLAGASLAKRNSFHFHLSVEFFIYHILMLKNKYLPTIFSTAF